MMENEYLEMLKTALEAEKKGQEFYEEVSKNTNNELGKKVFYFLAKDELAHIYAIKEFSKKLIGNEVLPDVQKVITRPHSKADESIFNRSVKELKEQVGVDRDDLSAYKIAKKIEREGYNFYKEALLNATDDKVRKLLQFLIEEESMHYKLLEESYDYLAHPADWFANEERPIFEGG